MKKLMTVCILLLAIQVSSQPNCEAYRYYGDETKYKACKAAEKRAGNYQFSRNYQEALDEALAIDSTFAFAYKAKSTAYLKSGDFITWKALMDKAVALEPDLYLDYRGWCRYQFFRDYQGAIDDIERLASIREGDIGHSVNGQYHLHVARALCYKALGQPETAIEVLTTQLQDSTHFLGLYDYLHLGVLYWETGQLEKALDALKRQEAENDLAEIHYYRALILQQTGQQEAAREELKIALQFYQNGKHMFDTYVEQMDRVYLEDIENALRLSHE
jgi:tetratricopeptide (TPR) repeat protein